MAEMRTIRELHNLAAGRPVFVVGTGPSVANFDWGRLKGQFAIALNDAIAFPFVPDVHLYNDCASANPLQWRYVRLAYDPKTKIVMQKTGHDYFRINEWKFLDQIYTYRQRGPDVDAGELWVDHTVSTAGLQLALWLGASAIYLMGCDGFRVGFSEYAFGVKDANDERTPVLTRSMDAYDHDRVKQWLEATGGGLPPDGIWNCSPHSIIETWPQKAIEEALAAEPDATLQAPPLA